MYRIKRCKDSYKNRRGRFPTYLQIRGIHVRLVLGDLELLVDPALGLIGISFKGVITVGLLQTSMPSLGLLEQSFASLQQLSIQTSQKHGSICERACQGD